MTAGDGTDIYLNDVLISDAEDLKRQMNEKQAILARVLEPQTSSEIKAAASQLPSYQSDALKVKKLKAGTSTDDVIERKIDEKMEQELKPELKEEHCIVCSTDLKGTNYMCPSCKTKYCIRCAIELSKRNEQCWTCKEPFKI